VIASIALVGVSMGRRIDLGRLAALGREVRLLDLLGICALYLGMQAARAASWILLEPRLRFREAWPVLLLSSLVANAMPLRMGEPAAILLLRRHGGLSWSRATFLTVAERLGQLLMAILLLFVSLFLLGHEASALVPENLVSAALLLGFAILGLGTVAWRLSRPRGDPRPQEGWRARLAEIRREFAFAPLRMALALGASGLFWSGASLAGWLYVHAIGQHLAPGAIAFVTSASSLTSVLLFAPGGVSGDLFAAWTYTRFGLGENEVFLLFTLGVLTRNLLMVTAGACAGAFLMRR
jgi:uncharacterized membrane protein YbhN (UPF0104 family)